MAERRSLSVSWGREGEAGHPKRRAPAGPGTRLLTFGPVTAAGCWETRRHCFDTAATSAAGFDTQRRPGGPRPASSGCTDRLGHGEGAEAALPALGRHSPHRPAPPRASCGPDGPGARGEHIPESERAPQSGPPTSPGAGQNRVGRARPGPPRPRSQHGVWPSLRAAHVPWLNIEGRREKPGQQLPPKGTPAAQKGPAEPTSEEDMRGPRPRPKEQGSGDPPHAASGRGGRAGVGVSLGGTSLSLCPRG